MTTSGIIVNHKQTESTHHRLFELIKTALIKIFVSPYATVCDLYCGRVADEDKWDDAQIGHYIGIDVESSGVNEIREAWESQRKTYTSQFFELDPSIQNVELGLEEDNMADIVFCMHHLQFCFDTEERVRRLLYNVATLLKPGGYFVGMTPDSSTIWAKYQKNVEAYHNKSGSMKPNIVPNCIKTESYMITFEVEEEKFPFFGKKYQLKFANDVSAEDNYLVHFPSLIRLARETGLEYVEIQNLTEFYDDNRHKSCHSNTKGLVGKASCVEVLISYSPSSDATFERDIPSMLLDGGHNLVDSRGRLLPKSYDVLGLYTTFIFQKPDPDMAPPLTTPLLDDANQNHDEMLQREWQPTVAREEEIIVPAEVTISLGKITEQKGILGPGPAELRFSEAL